MIEFTTVIKKFDSQGEKTGWTYIELPASLAQELLPGNKKSFRVKGKLDNHSIKGIALLPMGSGNFIMPLNAEMRKAIDKRKGAMLKVQLLLDKEPFKFCEELMDCLKDEPGALANFKKMPGSYQKYYSKWIDAAKTESTKAKRIAMTINAMLKQQDFGQMLRENQDKKLQG